MSKKMGRGVVLPLVLAAGVVLTGVSGGVASATPPPLPDVDMVSGQEAIDRIQAGAPLDLGSPPPGTELSRDEIIEMFRDDPSLHLSGDQLIYVELGTDPAAEAPITAQSAGPSAAPTAGSPFDEVPRLRDIVVSPEDAANAFKLHSRPESNHKIYLDFDGHFTDDWIGILGWSEEFAPFDLDGDPTTFSTTEREWMVRWWSRVVADFDTWDVDVTTEEPPLEYLSKSDDNDETYGVRLMVTSTQSTVSPNVRGIATVGSFTWNKDRTAYTFVNRETFDSELNFIWEEYTPWVISHESGHTLGLSHDNFESPDDFIPYYPGHNGWAPIMGGGLITVASTWPEPRTTIQWSKGEYLWADNTQDDRAIIDRVIGALPDDHSSSPTPVQSGVTTPGVINSAADTDEFRFATSGGPVEIEATLPLPGKELDLSLEVRDSSGNVVASKNTPGVVAETVTFDAAPGRYVVTVDGVGTGDPNTGYSDYSSTGAYELVVTAADPERRPDLIDFDGDGVGDVFTAVPLDNGRYQWQYSSAGSGTWTKLSSGNEPLERLRFGDFDGDGKTDVFTGTPTNGKYQWKYSSGGVGEWQNLLLSAYPFQLLRLGDFDGDGKTDVFAVSPRSNGNRWRYSSGGATGWKDLGLSSEPLEQLRFGDFDGDGITDVFTGTPTNGKFQWKYSSGGVGPWQNLLLSAHPFELLRFGDFDGDGKTDVFNASPRSRGNRWRYSSGGVSGWKDMQLSAQPFDLLRFGDFDGDGTTDVFTIYQPANRWQYISAGTSSWRILATSPVPYDQLRFGYISAN